MLLQLGDCVAEMWFIGAIDAALHAPWKGEPVLSAAEYARFAALLPRRRRRLVHRVNPLAGSCIETLLRLRLERRAIGPLILQFSPDEHRFVDILISGRRLILEGEEFHDSEQDAIRYDFWRSLGYVVLRFSCDRIVCDLEGVLNEIEDVLAAL